MQTVECFIKQRLCFVVEVAVSIKEITEDRWDQIVQLEAAAYSDIAPESKETLRSKWLASPDLCFVFEQEFTPTSIALDEDFCSFIELVMKGFL